jgi:Antp family protein
MSSYQFVNSLATCYNGPQRGQPGHQDTIAAVAAVHAAAGNTDYYNANNYPANCYSPQVSPHYGPYAPAATPQSHHNLAQGGNAADYNATHQHAVAAAAAHQRLNTSANITNTSPGAPTPPSATPVSSCKYADSTASSPQDLSTSSGNTPVPQPRSPTESSTTVPNTTTSASANNSSAVNNTSQQNSTSSSSNNSTSSKGNSSGNPPHIYPWMKRVHLGQSE